MCDIKSLDLDTLVLDQGSHTPASGKYCLLEAAAKYCEDIHADRPKNVCPVLAIYGRTLNDRMPFHQRQRLKQFIPLLCNTRDKSKEKRRLFMAADWAVRVFAAKALNSQGVKNTLAECAPIVDRPTARAGHKAAAAYAAYAYAADAAAYAAAAIAAAVDAAADTADTAVVAYAAAYAAYAAVVAAAATADAAVVAYAAAYVVDAAAAAAIWDDAVALFEALITI